MNGASDEFLAGSRLAPEEDRRIGWCHNRNLLEQVTQGEAAPDDSLEFGLRFLFESERFVTRNLILG
jgi:hypothetical protein